MPLTVALVYNLKRSANIDHTTPADAESEYDTQQTIAAIADGLRMLRYDVHAVEANRGLVRWLLTHPVDLVFNIAEGMPGTNRESQVPAVLDLLHIPYTGSNAVTLALALDKARTKQLLQYEGILTPRFHLVRAGAVVSDMALPFPRIVKPNREGSAKGITRESVVYNLREVRRQIDVTRTRYGGDVLVEEFIAGTEITAGVLGETPLPVLEIDFSSCRASGEYFYSWRMKEYQGDAAQGLIPRFYCPARMSVGQARAVQEVAWRAHTVLGCRGLSRTDIRLGNDGRPYVLEVNPLPGLDPLASSFPMMARGAGLSFESLLARIVEHALPACEAAYA